MAYVALYRKWRPQNFDQLVGQNAIAQTLSQALQTGRIAHAYLFSGPRGTGKTSAARILAKALNCEAEESQRPCGQCESCRAIDQGSFSDVYEIDAASNRGIDDIRELREGTIYGPANGHRWKVYIIDEVHMLTAEAFNALLKTLEEPPANVVFILATTEARKVPATIQSRCQRFAFRRLDAMTIENRLQEVMQDLGKEYEPKALQIIARAADGGMRDALSLLDQCVALSTGDLNASKVENLLGLVGQAPTHALTLAIARGDTPTLLQQISSLLAAGKDCPQILAELTEHFRALMAYRLTHSLEGLGFYQEVPANLEEELQAFGAQDLFPIAHALGEAMREMRWSPEPRVSLEIALLGLFKGEATGAQGKTSPVVASSASENERFAHLEDEIQQLKSMLQQGASMRMPKSSTPSKPTPKPALANAVPKAGDASQEAGQHVFDGILKKLKELGRVPALEIFKYASLQRMTSSEFRLLFDTEFLRDRALKEDYRQLIEGIIKELTGNELRLTGKTVNDNEENVLWDNTKKDWHEETEDTASDAKNENEEILHALPPEEQSRVDDALSIMGGGNIESVTDNPVDDEAEEEDSTTEKEITTEDADFTTETSMTETDLTTESEEQAAGENSKADVERQTDKAQAENSPEKSASDFEEVPPPEDENAHAEAEDFLQDVPPPTDEDMPFANEEEEYTEEPTAEDYAVLYTQSMLPTRQTPQTPVKVTTPMPPVPDNIPKVQIQGEQEIAKGEFLIYKDGKKY